MSGADLVAVVKAVRRTEWSLLLRWRRVRIQGKAVRTESRLSQGWAGQGGG